MKHNNSFINAPITIDKNVYVETFIDNAKLRFELIISPTKAPINGPTISPHGEKNKPIRSPIFAPHTAFLHPPA